MAPSLNGEVLSLSGIVLYRGETMILDGLSWRVGRGEHWAVIGPNGSGKTTLLNIVAGYLWPSRGTVRLLGETFGETNLPELRKRIGWVSTALRDVAPPREKALNTVLSGAAASIGLRAKVSPDQVERARDLLSSIGCAHRETHTFETLSQGEQQRVLIARALMADPELLILDEVCAGLDLAAREVFLGGLDALAGRPNGPTLVLVTHHIEEIMPAFSHVLAIKEGRPMAAGAKDEVLSAGLLSELLGVPLALEKRDGRHWPRLVPDGQTACSLNPTLGALNGS